MENVLLTRDAAYQYTRWSEAYRQFLRAQEKEEAAALLPHEAAIQAAIERLALPYIHNLLPHRRNEPCCTEGYCQPCAASSSELLDMHRLVHPGRPFLYLPPLRDEECACLAHSTAVLQVRRVQQVVLSGYKGGGLTDGRGIRCLLHHLRPVRCVLCLSRTQSAEGTEVLAAVTEHYALPDETGRSLTLLNLTPEDKSAFTACLRSFSSTDALAQLSLQQCAVTLQSSWHSFYQYLSNSTVLTSLTLYEMDNYDFLALGTAVAQCRSLSHVALGPFPSFNVLADRRVGGGGHRFLVSGGDYTVSVEELPYPLSAVEHHLFLFLKGLKQFDDRGGEVGCFSLCIQCEGACCDYTQVTASNSGMKGDCLSVAGNISLKREEGYDEEKEKGTSTAAGSRDSSDVVGSRFMNTWYYASDREGTLRGSNAKKIGWVNERRVRGSVLLHGIQHNTSTAFREALGTVSLRGVSFEVDTSRTGEELDFTALIVSCPKLQTLRFPFCTWNAHGIQKFQRLFTTKGDNGLTFRGIDVSGIYPMSSGLFKKMVSATIQNTDGVNSGGAFVCSYCALTTVLLPKIVVTLSAFLSQLSEVNFSHCGLSEENILFLSQQLEKRKTHHANTGKQKKHSRPLSDNDVEGEVHLKHLFLAHNAFGGSVYTFQPDTTECSGTTNQPAGHTKMNKPKRDGDTTGGGTDGCFPFLCRALRAENLPYLSTLDLSGNRLPLRSLLTLVDQVTCQLRTLQLSYTSISNDRKERASLLTGIMRRQQRYTSLSHLEEEGTSNAPFAHLDVYLVSSLTSDNIHKNSAMTVDTEWPTTLECVKWLSRQTAVQLIR